MRILRRSVLRGLAGGAVGTLLPGLAAGPALGAPGRPPLDDLKVGSDATEIFRPLVEPAGEAKGMIVGVTYRKADGTFARRYLDYGKLPPRQGGKGKAHPKDVVMFIASCTKVFTGTMLALAATYDNLPQGINQPVSDLLPKDTTIKLYNNTPILLWHLASHCSGFPTGACPAAPKLGRYPFSDLKAFLNNFQPIYASGEHYLYSNQGFILLGCLLSLVFSADIYPRPATWNSSYQQWANQVGTLVTQPLNMQDTVVDYTPLMTRVAQGYNIEDGEPEEQDPPDWDLHSAGLPAGALCSTAQDMLTFLEAQIAPPSGRLGKAIQMSQNAVSPMKGVGLGWEIGNDYLAKDGGFNGYSSYMIVDVKAAIGVIVLCNTWKVNEATKNGGRELLHRLRGTALGGFDHNPLDNGEPKCPRA
jgi:CubicO group peptidase (beta-lactamase class C family)